MYWHHVVRVVLTHTHPWVLIDIYVYGVVRMRIVCLVCINLNPMCLVSAGRYNKIGDENW